MNLLRPVDFGTQIYVIDISSEKSISYFRLILQELGYQSGQHELLADSYGKECSKAIEGRLKDVKNEMKKIKKEAEAIEKNLSQSYKSLDSKKQKYQKAHQELEVTMNTFHKTESDGTISMQLIQAELGYCLV